MIDLTSEGTYENRCHLCGRSFVGYKNAPTCHSCAQRPVSNEALVVIAAALVVFALFFGPMALRIMGVVDWSWWAVSALPVGSTVISAVFFLMLVWKDTR